MTLRERSPFITDFKGNAACQEIQTGQQWDRPRNVEMMQIVAKDKNTPRPEAPSPIPQNRRFSGAASGCGLFFGVSLLSADLLRRAA